MITDKAVQTVLMALGLTYKDSTYLIMKHGQGLVPIMYIENFEEIRYHELRIKFQKIYRQNKYLKEANYGTRKCNK